MRYCFRMKAYPRIFIIIGVVFILFLQYMDCISHVLHLVIETIMAFAKMLNSQAAVALSVLVSSSSAITAGIMEQRKRRLEKNRQKIEDKLSFIFAPLKGNRLLHQASIEGTNTFKKCLRLKYY